VLSGKKVFPDLLPNANMFHIFIVMVERVAECHAKEEFGHVTSLFSEKRRENNPMCSFGRGTPATVHSKREKFKFRRSER
jgi:hypothetical protein